VQNLGLRPFPFSEYLTFVVVSSVYIGRVHSRSDETGFELFNTTLYRAGADRIAIFAEFLVAQPALMGLMGNRIT